MLILSLFVAGDISVTELLFQGLSVESFK